MVEKHSFFATTAKGMEELLLKEIQECAGAGLQDAKLGRSGVSFQGTLESAYRVCLWSRIANRVLLPLKTFAAPNPEKLYGGVKAIRWSDHLDVKTGATIAVDFSSSQSEITHTHFGALKVKDAIVDQLRSIHGERPSVDIVRPSLRINVYLLKDEATVSLDLSGDSLHKRGYREQGSEAPLKENLAAAILQMAGWPELLKTADPQEISFLDPMCGSGTLPIEAAMMAAHIAPGLNRTYYGFLGWQGHVPALWKRLQEEARAAVITDRKKLPRIIGYDRDFRIIATALSNVEKAGVHGKVHIEKREFSTIEPPTPKGMIVINPPYGERLGEIEELRPLYKEMGDTFKQKFKGWTGFIFTGSLELSKGIGLKAARRMILFNGAMECRLFKFDLY